MDVKFKISGLRWYSDEELVQKLKERVLNNEVSFRSGDGFFREGRVNNVEVAKGDNFKCVIFAMDSGIGTLKYSVNVLEDIVVHNYNFNRVYSSLDPYGEEVWED